MKKKKQFQILNSL